MKPITLNSKSWHYEVASWANFEHYPRKVDICEYTKSVFMGLLLMAIVMMLAVVFGSFMIYLVLDFWFAFSYGLAIGAAGTIGIMITLSTVLVYGFSFLWRVTTGTVKQSGFAQHAYRSWKEKYCVPVTFEREF